MNSEQQWYFILDNDDERRQEGPVSTEHLAELHSSGQITSETLVWHAEMTDWEPIGTVQDFLQPLQQDAESAESDFEVTEPAQSDLLKVSANADGPSDTVTIQDFGNHSVRFSKSRNVLLIFTNDNQAGPLELTKLDLLGFLTTMETSTRA